MSPRVSSTHIDIREKLFPQVRFGREWSQQTDTAKGRRWCLKLSTYVNGSQEITQYLPPEIRGR